MSINALVQSMPFPGIRKVAALVIILAAQTTAPTAAAQNARPAPPKAVFSPGLKFTEPNGESLFVNVCSGCHMTDGRGATGAATFPSLADNAKLQSAGYPLSVIVHGLHGMPPLGAFMSDDQVASVVNYVRTHFGNNYQPAVVADDVKAIRP